MKKLATLSMCALSFLAVSAGATYPIPVDLEVPGYRTPEQTSMTVEDGVYTINFAGEYPAEQEYDMFTSETTLPMLDGVTYCLEFDYQCAENLDDVNWLYWPKNGVTQSWCHDWLKGHLAPTAEGEWGHAKLTFTDRFKYGFGRGTGQVVRLHLRPSSHKETGDKKGQPFSVKIKDISFVPVQAEAPETTDVLPVEIGDVTKSDLDYVSKEVNAEGEYTLTWQGNFAALGNSGHYIEYNAFTAEMPHGMMPGIDYKLVFEYKGPALDDFSGLYHNDGLYGDNVGTQSKVSIPASEDWTTVELPLADRGSHNWWGWSATSSLRLNFNDGSYTSQEGANFGKPLTVQVRGLRFEPVILPQPEPETIDLSLIAIAPHDGEALQEDGSYVINFTGEFAGNPWTEYDAHLSKLTADLVAGENYYLAFEYQADDVIDEFVGRYWDDITPIIGSTPNKVLPATDQWTPVLLPLTNRVDCGWGKAGHGMRIHFYNNARMTKPEATPASRAESKYGQPMTVKVRGFKYVPEKIVTAIENVAVDGAEAADAEPEYYNIQGQRVMNPGKGLYIVRHGSKVTKVIL